MQSCKRVVTDDPFSYLKILCEDGRLRDAIRAADTLHKQGVRIPIHVFFHFLQSCISKSDLALGRELHFLIINSGFEHNAFLASHLIRMFSTCQSLPDAKQVFSNLPTHAYTVYTWNAIISAHVKHGQYENAIDLYHTMCTSGLHLDKHVLVAVLKACSCKSTVNHGRYIHAHIVKLGFELDCVVCNTLVAMYIKSGCIDDAHLVFTLSLEKNAVTWNAMISGYAHHGHGFEALHLFSEMYRDGYEPTLVTYVCIFKACGTILALLEGRLIHVLIMKHFLEQETFMGSSLIDFYAKCGSLEDAHKIFNTLPKQDVATWNAIIGAFAQKGLGNTSMNLFQEMQNEGFKPDNVTFLSILKACSSITDLEQGKLIDARINQCGLGYDAFIATTLIDMYVKCGSIKHASRVFCNSTSRDVVTWNTMIGGCAQHDQVEKVLDLFQQMQHEGVNPDTLTYMSLLKTGFSSGSLNLGKLIHTCILGASLEDEAFVENSIVDMYAKFGSMEDAHNLFARLPRLDVVSWNTMISGYVQHHQSLEALQVLHSMQQEGMEPDKVTCVLLLKACSSISSLDHGKLVHTQIIEIGCESDALIESTLIDLYAKCGIMDDARGIFTKASQQSVHAWNMLVSGYVHWEQFRTALEIFENMQQETVQPNEMTFIFILQACCSLEALESIKVVNDLVIRGELEHDVYVMSTLIDVYSKCGMMEEAVGIFNNIPNPGVVTWTGLISGHVQHGNGQEALQLFYQMQMRGVEPNEATFVCTVKACIILKSVEHGKLVHDCIIQKGFASNEVIGSALIDMYATCGSINDAFKVFSKLPSRDMVTWNVIIAGFALCNDHEMALQHFEAMKQEGLQPDVVTFVSLLAACSQMGLMNEGIDIFECLGEHYSTPQMIDHLNCLIDLLGRSGHLSKAEDVLQAIPPLCSNLGWRSLLGHCQTHGDVQLGRRCFDRLFELGIANASVYKLMSNIYSRAGMWEDAQVIEGLRVSQNAWEIPANVSAEARNRWHDSVAGYQSHTLCDASCDKSGQLLRKIEEKEYIPCLESFPEQDQIPVPLRPVCNSG